MRSRWRVTMTTPSRGTWRWTLIGLVRGRRRRLARRRTARLLPRQGPQRTDHPTHEDHHRRPACLARRRHGDPIQPLFPNRTGGRLSRDAVEKRLARHATTASATYPSLAAKHVTAHTLRHTAAMRLLHAGVDTSIIALWMGMSR
jgi:integrase